MQSSHDENKWDFKKKNHDCQVGQNNPVSLQS